jgi:hypothetical protein
VKAGRLAALLSFFDLCYTCRVNSNPHLWQIWADALHRWGLDNLVATLLESTGPLNILGAQLVYLGQPVLGQFLSQEHSNAFANLLESPEMTQAFSTYLRKHTQLS